MHAHAHKMAQYWFSSLQGVWIANGLGLRPKGNSYTCSRKFSSFNSKDNVFPSFIDLPPSPPSRHILRRRRRSYHHHFFDLNLIIELICPKYQPILLIEASSRRINTSEMEAYSSDMMDWRRRIRKASNQVISSSFPCYA